MLSHVEASGHNTTAHVHLLVLFGHPKTFCAFYIVTAAAMIENCSKDIGEDSVLNSLEVTKEAMSSVCLLKASYNSQAVIFTT